MMAMKRWVLCSALVAGLSACGAVYDPSSLTLASNKGRASEGAMAALEKGDYARAETLGKNALRENSQDPYAILALAVVYQNTGRQDLARQYYEGLVTMKPQATMMTGMGPNAERRTIAEIAQSNLAALDATDSARPKPVVSPPMPDFGQQLSGENAVITRFQTLRRLLDEGLITREEYDQRRGANLPGLLRYSLVRRPAAGLERPAPSPDQVVQRLRALAAAYQEGSISANEQAVERGIILDGLLPGMKAPRADRPTPISTEMDAAAAAGFVTRMAEAGVVTPAEQGRERNAIFTALASAQADREAASRLAAGLPEPEMSAVGPGVQLAVVKSESQARSLWETLKSRYPDQLGGLMPSIRRVSTRHRGSHYVLSAGTLSDRKAAVAVCRELKRHHQACSPTTIR